MSTDRQFGDEERTLHLALTRSDFSDACRCVRDAGGREAAVHWILSSERPDPALPLPAEVEWIRLPETLSGHVRPGDGRGLDRDWLHALTGLVDALGPDVVFVHRDFATRDTERRDEIRSRLSSRARLVELNGTDAENGDERRRDRPLKVGYVLKKFPRYSETFILREILALEAAGVAVQTFSLHLPWDGRFHASLAELAHTVEYLPEETVRTLPAAFPLVPADPASRAAFDSLLWECVDRGDQRLLGYLAQAIHVAGRVKRLGITHLHAHFATSASEVARMAAHLAGIGFSFTAHAKDIYADDVDRRGLQLKFTDCRFAVTVCEANRRFLHDRHPESRDKVRVLYNGIDLRREGTGLADVGLEDAGQDGPPTVLAVGRFVEKKGFDRLLHAFALLRDRGVSFQGRILGDGELLEPMRGLCSELGLVDRVALPGAVSSEQVRQAMQHATLLICPSVVASDGDQDALPTVLLEAMSQRLPCIATPVGGIREILDEGRAGLIVDDGAEAIADAVEKLVSSPALQQRYVAHATDRVQACFDIHRNVGTLMQWFVQAASKKATASRPLHESGVT